MPESFHFTHLYKYPLEMVALAHYRKFPDPSENMITSVETVENFTKHTSGDGNDNNDQLTDSVTYWRRIAYCRNIFPGLVRRFSAVTDQPEVLIQEESWLYHGARKFVLKSLNLTWADYAVCLENSEYHPAAENANWTECVQSGSITIHGIGPLGPVFEKLARIFLDKGMKKGMLLMENNLRNMPQQKISQPPTEGAGQSKAVTESK